MLMLDGNTKKIALFYETLTLHCKKSPSILYKLANGALLFTTHDKLDMKLANTLLLKVRNSAIIFLILNSCGAKILVV